MVPDGGPAEVFTSGRTRRAPQRDFLARHQLGRSRGLMAVSPGRSALHQALAHRALDRPGGRLAERNDVIVLGGPGDREVAAAIAAAGGGRAVSAAGEFTLAGTAALLKRVRVVAAADTGVLHLATAVGTPVVGLYGPTVEQFGFFPYHARAAVLQRDLPCRPCTRPWWAKCPLGHHRCLRGTLPERWPLRWRPRRDERLVPAASHAARPAAAAERGPKREGAFALWMLVRVALDLGLAGEVPDKADRRRVALLARRLAPLAVPRPLARGLPQPLATWKMAGRRGAGSPWPNWWPRPGMPWAARPPRRSPWRPEWCTTGGLPPRASPVAAAGLRLLLVVSAAACLLSSTSAPARVTCEAVAPSALMVTQSEGPSWSARKEITPSAEVSLTSRNGGSLAACDNSSRPSRPDVDWPA